MKFLLLIIVALLMFACEEGNKPDDAQDYTVVVGDTVITIPAEAVRFAGSLLSGEHFQFHAYVLREYQVAINPAIPRGNGSAYTGSLVEWKNMGWGTRRTFLVAPYAHDVTTDSPELFYYMIGTYPDQFGYGWVDTYDPEANLWDGALRPWNHPADSTLTPDNPSTLEFDGDLGDMLEYRGMWVVE